MRCIILIDDISLRSSSSIIFCLSLVGTALSFTFLREVITRNEIFFTPIVLSYNEPGIEREN